MNKVLVFLFLIISADLFGQQSVVEYHIGFEFNEGVYLSFDEFKQNRPGITEGLKKKGESVLVYNDSLKKYLPIDPDKVWGYSTGRGVYISMEGNFSRLNLIGKYAQFTALIESQSYSYDPYGFQISTENKVPVQFLLNFDNGKPLQFSKSNFEAILQKDPLLWKEYRHYKGRKSEKLFIFLRKYNDKYPIYFPPSNQ